MSSRWWPQVRLLAGLCLMTLWLSLGARPAAADLEDWCGQEGEPACARSTSDYQSNGGLRGCDRGLKPNVWRICVNDTRYQVTPDAWAVATLAFQRELEADRPINDISWLSSHNAFNNLADGYYAPNQVYSITDQLRMGVRHFMLDVYWYNDQIRLCHGFCRPDYRFLYHALREINHWLRLPENQNEIVFIRFEDGVEPGHDEAINEPIRLIVGDIAYTPADKPADRWPTLNEMRALGKRIIFFSENKTWGGSWVFPDWHEPPYPLDKVYHFDRNWPTCTYSDDNGLPWSLDRSAFSEFYESRLGQGHDTGLITAAVMQDLLACSVSVIGTDRFMPARSAQAVWSWAVDRPNGSGACAVLRGADGRWLDVACGGTRPYACVQADDPANWRVTTATGPWSGGMAACATEFPGFVFGLPRDANENRRVVWQVDATAWINISLPARSSTFPKS